MHKGIGLYIRMIMIMATLGGIMLFPIRAYATELTLTDYGDGFYLPTNFDLRDADGKILTAPKLDTSLWGAGEYEEEKEMILDNGMKAVRLLPGRKPWSRGNTGPLTWDMPPLKPSRREITAIIILKTASAG